MTSRDKSKGQLEAVLGRIDRPKKAVVTAGMPYANGPLHIGHMAGAHLPADIHARWLGLVIGRQNVLFVCGTDDHGSTTELSALQAGKSPREVIDEVHAGQKLAMDRYDIGLDIYTGTSQPANIERHTALCQHFIRRLYDNGLLEKRTSRQWWDPQAQRFLPDRMVRGTCPNPKCGSPDAYANECSTCGHQHEPEELISPRSAVTGAIPEMRDTVHLWLDMWTSSDVLFQWVSSKKKTWRPVVTQQVLETVAPALRFDRDHEDSYKEIKKQLPGHKLKYAAGGQVVLRCNSKADLKTIGDALAARGIDSELADDWAHRAITRDIDWGIPIPDVDPDVVGKTLYVWPESLIAPMSFCQQALAERGEEPERYKDYWCDPEARVYQFLGQDNVFFYVVMQGAMWLGTQDDPTRMPEPGDYQLTDVFGCFHLMVDGDKMSKSRGNFYTATQLLDEKGYSTDQLRYYLALLGLADSPSNFDFEKLDNRNEFLARTMNAVFERPISAAHSKFDGRVPDGELIDKAEADTGRIVARYVKAMQKANYPSMLFELENYARKINSLFTKYKPHDDRHPEKQRADALYTAFYVLKSVMIMLQPFVPGTMERLRQSLNLPEDVFSVDQLGTPIPAGHPLGEMQSFFPSTRDE